LLRIDPVEDVYLLAAAVDAAQANIEPALGARRRRSASRP
jgi:hypothetical protein